MCMPTVVSYLLSNAFGTKVNGAPSERQLFNTRTDEWEEPDAEEKGLLLGHRNGDTGVIRVSDEDRSIRLGRALDGHTMRWLGAILHVCQA